MASSDVRFVKDVSRVDRPMIIAQNRELATIMPVRLAYNASGYLAGTVLGRNNVSGDFAAYSNAGSSGTDTATCVLFESAKAGEFDATTGTVLARAIFGGELYKDMLVGLDTDAESDLKARTIVDATNVNILKF